MIFDTHAHYYDEAFDADRDALLASLPGRGVALVVCPGCDLESSRQSIALAERYGFLYAAAGYHPENLEGAALSDLDAVKACAPTPRWWRWSEIGLDYYWLKTPEERANSRDFFDAQLSLAEELNLPAIVHDRDAHRDCLDIVRAHPGVRGVFHCYSGGLEDAKVLVDQGWMLSFTGNITFKNARRAPDILRWSAPGPADAGDRRPYMAPEPYRGQRCDSTMIARSAETVAQLRGLTRDEVEAVTLENGKKFFGIA
ncbi:MAG: TatD family hydrolase [Flavonifractor plautii]